MCLGESVGWRALAALLLVAVGCQKAPEIIPLPEDPVQLDLAAAAEAGKQAGAGALSLQESSGMRAPVDLTVARTRRSEQDPVRDPLLIDPAVMPLATVTDRVDRPRREVRKVPLPDQRLASQGPSEPAGLPNEVPAKPPAQASSTLPDSPPAPEPATVASEPEPEQHVRPRPDQLAVELPRVPPLEFPTPETQLPETRMPETPTPVPGAHARKAPVPETPVPETPSSVVPLTETPLPRSELPEPDDEDSETSVPGGFGRSAEETPSESSRQQAAISDMIAALAMEDKHVVSAARSELRNLGLVAVPALIDAMGHESVLVRSNAIRTLRRLDVEFAADALGPLLEALLAGQDKSVRAAAATALGQMDFPAHDVVPSLVEALRDKDSLVRENAARALGAIGPAAGSAVGELRRLKTGDRYWVRVAASRALQLIAPGPRKIYP